ncbi:MAG: Na+ dependent nucleoside transporter domain-containing protein [Elusimicrobia bacterium RIFOXYA2_FULL_58_8]|nr:MAG: Na+ dependent nucleoside transporter domain-containing protein [Elusimicrobia bacterium RIFOXYA12_FULL_57_11]OGS12491.1 MAG: Na+ dependent nucleoside transporter domain-containing protein [Elusimicrobia bacterium RIFOXYA2_FULL_58_8]
MEKIIGFFGVFVMLGIAWAFSKNRKAINYKTVAAGIAIQVTFAILVLKLPWGRYFFQFMNDVIVKLLSFSDKGAEFVFGPLVSNPSMGFIFAVRVLPTIIFVSAIMGVLYYLGIMQKVVLFFAKIMARLMGTSGAESLSASANVFVGQTEAPLVVRPYVAKMTNSELMAIMTGGMATISGGIMAAYVGLLVEYLPNIAGHLLAASIMAAPAGLVMAKILVPETEEPVTRGIVKIELEITDANVIDAAANGSTVGMQLAINVAACLIAFMAILAMANFLLGYGAGFAGIQGLTIEKIFGWLFTPLAWVMGVPRGEVTQVASWMGQKTVLNEFVAYLNMATYLKANPGVLSDRSLTIASYALCGFSNFLSIAIQIGGIGAMAPERRHDLARLGLYAMLASSLAGFMSATIAGLLI